MTVNDLAEKIQSTFSSYFAQIAIEFNEITIECSKEQLKSLLKDLRDHQDFLFKQLTDICAVDYLTYGLYDWETVCASENGFSRGVEPKQEKAFIFDKPRFAVVYHLLSLAHNERIRIKVYLEEHELIIPSVCDIWPAANWFEREAYDLYGVLFEGHPDLRRILTDYGFIGYPFRKDFPLSGHVEMRYDAKVQKVIYEPVNIIPRVLVPKVIREDNRYDDLLTASNREMR